MSGLRNATMLGLSLALAAPIAAHAAVLFRGDLSTGNLSQWLSTEAAAVSRVQVVTSPLHNASHTLRIEVDSGDLVNGGARAEVDGPTEVEGAERYYAWSTFFPSDYPNSSQWQVFTQWHHSGPDGSPPLSLDADSEQVKLVVGGSTTLWSTPLVRNVWHDFVFHVKFSPDPSVGFVEIWLDGAHVLARTSAATSYSGQTVYLKQGYYRSQAISGNQVLYHSGMVEGETFSDVVPPAAPAPDFSLTAVDKAQTVAQGATATFRVSETALNGFTGTVGLSASGLPSGATATVEAGSGGQSLIVVSTAATAAVGTSNLIITGTSGGLSHTASAALTISASAPVPSGDFSLALAATGATVEAGAADTVSISATRVNGFAGAIGLAVSGLPEGITAAVASIAAGASSASITMNVASTVVAGSYPFTVTGAGGSLQRNAAGSLTVSSALVAGGTGGGTGTTGGGTGPTGTGAAGSSGPAKGGTGFPSGGCTSAGTTGAWALGLLALLALRRRKPAQARLVRI